MELFIIGFTWVCYFALHSLFATDAFKQRVRVRSSKVAARFPVFYNLFAAISLFVPVRLVLDWHGPDLYAPADFYALIDRLVQLLAVCGFLWALASYDLRELGGVKTRSVSLRTNGPLQLCRHPMYFFGLVMLWAGAQNAATLLTAALTTIYVLIGMRVEERRLLTHFGKAYELYRKQVPALIPRPWRLLARRRTIP